MTDRVIWGIHMRREYGLGPIAQGYIAIGWREMGDLSLLQPVRDAFKAAYERAYPNSKEQTVRTSAGVPFRFLVEMKVGDIVISLSFCRFHGHRDKVFSRPEGVNATTEVQPRV